MIKEFKNWKEDVARRKEYRALMVGVIFGILIAGILILIRNTLNDTFNVALVLCTSAIFLGKFGAEAAKFVLFLLDDRKSKEEAE